MGKPESGILQGNFIWLGTFDECENVDVVQDGVLRFTGQYCWTTLASVSIYFQFSWSHITRLSPVEIEIVSKTVNKGS